jgi:23S rRNA (uracil1939-C5)-methyltransferase
MPHSPIIETVVEDVAFGGDGVARHDGKAVFIPYVIDGEKVSARITRQKKKFAAAELESVIETSPHRIPAPCPYFGRCGGCSYQHITYSHQLELKSRQVEQTLRRVGRLAEVPMQPIIPSPETYGYRNRIRVHIDTGAVGFYAHGKHDLVEIETCAIAAPEVNAALREIRGRALYDGDYTVSGKQGGRFFEQTNNAVGDEMLRLAERLVKRGQALLVDAYCGAGFFAKHLAGLFGAVIGIEENEHAVAHALSTAGASEKYIAGDVEFHLPDALAAADRALTTLILDPPATGITPRVCDLILAAMPAEIVYVSCDPATLARDIGHLVGSYELLSVTPLDMFPQTAEIEAVAHLRARS